MAESLLEALTGIRQLLREKAYQNEEHVRFSLVGRLLLALGWNVWHPAEVNTEEKPHEGENHTKVDVSLRIRGEHGATVYVECKRVGKLLPALEKVEKQMSDYNQKNAANLIVLTDGQHWRLYYPHGTGSFRDRHFADYDLTAADLTAVAADFTALLGRAAVAGGGAVEQARSQWQQRRRWLKMQELKPVAQANLHYARSLMQELLALMHTHGYPSTTEAEVKAFLAGEAPAKLAPAPPVAVDKAPKKPAAPLPKAAPVAEPPAPLAGLPRFQLKARGASATGFLLPDGTMRVLAGSTAAGTTTNSFTKKPERDALLAAGTLVSQGEHLLFTRDHTFKTPRRAADIIVGNPVNAQDAWRREGDNQPLGNFLAANQSKD